MLGCRQPWILLYPQGGILSGDQQPLEILRQPGDTKRRQSRLSCSKQFSRATEFQILLGNPEAVVCFRDGFHSCHAIIGDGISH